METLLKRFQSFRPPTLKDKGAEFANLRQRALNIEEYVAKFSSLLRFAPHVSGNDEAMADQFINGLNPDVFTLVNTGRPDNFADALNRAKGAEAGLLRQKSAPFVAPSPRPPLPPSQVPPPRFESGGSSSGRKDQLKAKGKQFKRAGSSSSSSSGSRQRGPGQGTDVTGVYCNTCGGKHATEQCQGVTGRCNYCRQPGHFAKVCPQRSAQRFQSAGSSASVAQPERQAPSVHSFQPPQTQTQPRARGSQTVSQPQRQQAQVFALTEEQAQDAPDDVIAGGAGSGSRRG
ncbi:uncharacterized protein [Primulina eburnea]|uniref:uncharacterized protein n=1 Tax=Primulina eburnea TaxID=1245227 RepID=UPI003C6BF911